MISTLRIVDDQLVLDFPYDKEQVDENKENRRLQVGQNFKGMAAPCHID